MFHGVIPSQFRSYSCTAVYTFIGIKIRASTRYEVVDYEDIDGNALRIHHTCVIREALDKYYY